MKSTSRWSQALLVAALTAGAISLSACSSESTEGAPATTTTVTHTTQAADPVPTTTGPEPISAEEKDWVRDLSKLQKRLEKTAYRGGYITRSRMLSDAKVFGSCKKELGRAPSERFARPYEIALKACERFKKAAAELKIAAANVDSSGAVVVGTVAEANFNRAFEHANAHTGNAVNRLSAAVAKAKFIRHSLPT
jgi:hypothetical protein